MSTTMELDLWPPAAPDGRDPEQAGPAGEPVTRPARSCGPSTVGSRSFHGSSSLTCSSSRSVR